MSDIIDDGLSGNDGDEDRARLIKGTKLQFTNDFQWVAGDEVIEADREFIVIKQVKAEQKWIDDRPVETVFLGSSEKWRDLDKLNDAEPRELWREKFGKQVGPWEHCRVVYLVDPQTWQIYTFPTSSWGGDQCVRDLRDATDLARRVRGQDLYPRVSLGDTFMKTSYGGRQRPVFTIKGYESLNGGQAAVTAEAPKLIEQANRRPSRSSWPSRSRKPRSVRHSIRRRRRSWSRLRTLPRRGITRRQFNRLESPKFFGLLTFIFYWSNCHDEFFRTADAASLRRIQLRINRRADAGFSGTCT